MRITASALLGNTLATALSLGLLCIPLNATAAALHSHAHGDHDHAHGAHGEATPAGNRPVASRIDSDAARTRTEALVALHKRWQQAAGNARASLGRQLLEQAEQRHQALRELASQQPGEALRLMIPEQRQSGMPAEVLARLEQPVELDGTLEVIYEDYEDGARLRHFLKTGFGERFELHLAKRHKEWRSGVPVRAQGWLLEGDRQASVQGDLLLGDDEQGLLLADDGTGSGSLAYEMPNTKGAQRTLTVLVNFQDKPNDKPWTTSQASTLVYGTVNEFIKENSAQQTWLTGQVAGWFTIPVNSTVCDGFAIERHAKEAAAAAGHNLSQYDRFIFAFPQNSACGYSGMGQVGALPSSSWIHNSLILRTVAHELGHNLGLYHAHATDCGDTTLGNSCSNQEYGDTVDIMGYPGTVGHFNLFSKERLGWLASGNLLTVGSAGSFTLQPNSLPTSAAKGLKIARGLDASGRPSYYYVELRKPLGFDAQITDRGVVDAGNIFNGVTIRQASPHNGNSGYLLDMTPGSAFVDMKDAALTGGRRFSDPDAGLSVVTEWVDGSQALVSVDFGSSTPTCTRSAPGITMTPGQSPWLAAGSSFDYSVTVTNRDSAGCTSSSFALAASRPAGWSTSLPSSLSLAPGASASVTLRASAPGSATDGFYNIGATASANALSASTSATYVIDNPVSVSNAAPVAVDDQAVLSSLAPLTVAVLANDSDPDGDALQIIAFEQGSKGKVSLNANGTLTYSPAKSFKSSDQFRYTISDGKLSASATVYISLQGSSSDSSTGSTGKGNGNNR